MPEPTLRLNEERLPWQPGESIESLLERAGLDPDTVATALNGTFVPQQLRAETLLQPDDQVTVFKAIVGG